MISTMKEYTGRVGVVMPHGVLFRGGREAEMRQWVIEQDTLEAVIGLPNNLFYSTSIPVCLLIFRAQKSVEREKHVLFIDARTKYSPGKNQNTLSDDDVDAIDAAYKRGEDIDGDGGLALQLVHRDKIREFDYDLNVGRYLQTETRAEADVDAALAALRDAQAATDSARETLDLRLKEAGFDA